MSRKKVSEFESVKDKAFNLMDLAKNELKQMNFDRAIELYEESGKILSDIGWQEGINMVKDSITMIKRRKKTFELEQEAIVGRREEERKIEEKLEERLAKADELRKFQQEEKRKEFLKIQAEKEWERSISGEAYEEFHELIKICLFADSDVGKETLIKSNFLERFYESYMSTIGVDFATKMIEHSGKIIKLEIWIISDDKRFQSIWEAYLGRSLGIILMYDITNAKTLNMVSECYQIIKNAREIKLHDIPILLVGNKLDLEEQREVSQEQVEKFKEDHDISSSMEISLKTGENVEEMFMKMTSMIMEGEAKGKKIVIENNKILEKLLKTLEDVKKRKKDFTPLEIKTIIEPPDDEHLPYPYIFKPPSPPGDLELGGEPQAKLPVIEEIQEHEPYCKHCGGQLANGQSICHVCGKKVI